MHYIIKNILILKLNKIFNTNIIDIKGNGVIKYLYLGNYKTNIKYCDKIEELVWNYKKTSIEEILKYYYKEILKLLK